MYFQAYSLVKYLTRNSITFNAYSNIQKKTTKILLKLRNKIQRLTNKNWKLEKNLPEIKSDLLFCTKCHINS
jgi:hypothetical protein